MSTPIEHLSERVYCQNCKGKTNHKIIQTYKDHSDPNDDFQWIAFYYIVKCSGCDKIAFVEQIGNEDSWDYIDGEREWVDIFKVYPEEPIQIEKEHRLLEKYRIEAKDFTYAPHEIVNLYNQIIESYHMNHMILCTSGLRTLIEVVCSELGIKKGYLYDENRHVIFDKDNVGRKKESLGGRIFEMYEMGLIIFPHALILQRIKDIGNGAIHEIKVPSISTLKESIHIIEVIIHNIYELKNHDLLR